MTDELRPESKPDIVAFLEELEAERRSEGMPVGARNRVRSAILQHESRRRAHRRERWTRWVPAASFAAGAVLVLAVVGSRWTSDVSLPPQGLAPSAVVAPVAAVGEFQVQGDGCIANQAVAAAELAAHCSLVAPHMTVQAWEPASIRAEGRNVAVTSGKVLFEVEDVPHDEAPVQVRVSHGHIEVVGTRFAVEQQPEGGHVDLLEGKIRFHHADGEVEDVLPGQRLSWGAPDGVRLEGPAEPIAEAAVELPDADDATPPPRKRTRARGTDAQAAAVIERVTELRAAKRYGAAITELRRALRRNWDRRTAQVLSYELGELLRAAEDTLGACEHFANHQAKYPSGRYDRAVERVLDRLDCE